MITHKLTAELEVPLPIETVFAFFAAAENLERITPPELRFRIESKSTARIQDGTIIAYRLSLYGIPFRWKTLISEWRPTGSFVDTQIEGPYRLWHHCHTFRSSPRGTLILDEVTYALPFSPLSEIAVPVVRMQLKKIFSFRQRQVIQELIQAIDQCPWHVSA